MLLTLSLHAQTMEVTGADVPPYSPEILIRDVFLGSGVDVLDIQYNGTNAAVGYFNKGADAIGLDRGIILTTGVAEKVTGTGRDGAQDNNDLNQMYRNEVDLEVTADGAPLRNVAVYTIRFIPTSDTLQFRYVFASEEYPEFVCSEFNDVFGFFISGPGFNGPYEKGGENIALVPETVLPVTINNVNNGQIGVWGDIANCLAPLGTLQFSDLFNDNQDSRVQPVFDGYTNVFTAQAIVQPCEEYVIKLAIADVTDEGYDSGVFLEAKSFGTSQLFVEAETASSDGAIAEGCAEGLITFSLARPLNEDFEVNYNVFGTATNGTDYNFLPGTLTIPAGDISESILITPFEDFTAESLETIYIEIQKDVCKKDTVLVYLKDNELQIPDIRDTAVCPGTEVTLDGQLPVQVEGPKVFSNNTAIPIVPAMTAVKSDIVVSGVYPFVLRSGMIESVCLNIQHNNPEDLDIYLIAPNGKFIPLTTDNGVMGTNYTNTCFTETASIRIDDPIASAPYSGSYLPEAPWKDLWDDPGPTNGTWSLLVYDDEFGSNGVIRDWSITFKPPYELFYDWQPPQSVNCVDCPAIDVTPPQTTVFTLEVTDSYGCGALDSAEVEIKEFPIAPVVICGEETVNSVTFEWAGVDDALFYEYSLNGGPWQILNPEDTSLYVGNLGLGEDVDLEIRTISSCIGQPASFACQTLDCTPPDLNEIAEVPVSCYGAEDASISFEAIGAAAQYTFSINNESNNTGEFTNLAAGDYTLTVTDDIGCASTLAFTIDQPDELLWEDSQITDVRCAGAADGTASITISGGTAPYNYTWSAGDTGDFAENLSAGTHTVTITDANNCLLEVDVEVNEPEVLLASPVHGKVSCYGSSDAIVRVEAQGGVGMYSYQWDTAANNQIGPEAVNLPGGTYSVTVSDGNGCQATSLVNVTENDSISILPSVSPASCFGLANGMASVIANGGAGNFSFEWSNGVSGTTANNLAAGTYHVTATDADNCSTEQTVIITEPMDLEVSVAATDAKCSYSADGEADLTISGGTPDYSVRWEDGGADMIRDDLAAGMYAVTISDANNCEMTAAIAIDAPDAIQLNETSRDPICANEANGNITLLASGGTGAFIYDWSHDQDLSGHIAENLPAGYYAVTVTDQNDCSNTINLNLVAPDSIEVASTVEPVKCNGQRDGAIILDAAGGTGILNYQWNGPNGFTSTSQNLVNLPAGSYEVEIIDGNGCSTREAFDIEEPASLSAEIDLIPVSCPNRTDGEIFIHAEGGTAPYEVKMGGFTYGNVQNIRNLRSGTYDLSIIDANGCEFEIAGLIVENAKLLAVDLGEDKVIQLGETVELVPEIENDFPIAQYEWSPEDAGLLSCFDCPQTTVTTQFQVNVKLVITDEKGCRAEDKVSIFVKKDRSVFVPTGFSPNGDGNNDRLIVHGKDGDRVKLMRIYDRWGELVFQAEDFAVNDIYAGWDGTFRGKYMNSGVYIWYLEVSYEDGLDASFDGSTTLIR